MPNLNGTMNSKPDSPGFFTLPTIKIVIDRVKGIKSSLRRLISINISFFFPSYLGKQRTSVKEPKSYNGVKGNCNLSHLFESVWLLFRPVQLKLIHHMPERNQYKHE